MSVRRSLTVCVPSLCVVVATLCAPRARFHVTAVSTITTRPTSAMIQPTMVRSTPLTWSVTASARTSPTTSRRAPTGLPQVVWDHFEYDATPSDLAAHSARLAELGIDLVGGCCGSTLEHIAATGADLAPA